MTDVTGFALVFVMTTFSIFSRDTQEWWILVHGYWWRWPLLVVSVGAVFVVLFVSESMILSRKKRICQRCGFMENSEKFVWVSRGRIKELTCDFCLSHYVLKTEK